MVNGFLRTVLTGLRGSGTRKLGRGLHAQNAHNLGLFGAVMTIRRKSGRRLWGHIADSTTGREGYRTPAADTKSSSRGRFRLVPVVNRCERAVQVCFQGGRRDYLIAYRTPVRPRRTPRLAASRSRGEDLFDLRERTDAEVLDRIFSTFDPNKDRGDLATPHQPNSPLSETLTREDPRRGRRKVADGVFKVEQSKKDTLRTTDTKACRDAANPLNYSTLSKTHHRG